MAIINRAKVTSLTLVAFFFMGLIYYSLARTENIQQFVQAEISNEPVVIFSKSYCPYCARAKKVLRERGVQFKAHELDQDDRGREVQKYLTGITGQATVPNIFINGIAGSSINARLYDLSVGKSIGGSDSLTRLIEEGKLDQLLEKKSAQSDEL